MEEKMSFVDFCNDLQYFYVEDHKEMTIHQIADKCREYIRENGYNCLDENFDEDNEVREWVKENHPEWKTDGFDWNSILYNNIEFLCIDSCDEPTFESIEISFYGDYDKGIGVFNVDVV